MRTLGAYGLDLSASIDKQHLCIEALDIDLLLVARLQVKRGDAGELVFLGHCPCCCAELVKLNGISDRKWLAAVC